jgi:chorismate synthase
MSSQPPILRPLASLAEYEACTELQEEVWGRGFSERVSAAILMIANRLGGLSAGAFDESGMLLGFVFGLTGLMKGELVHWSDMLAVHPDVRDQGLGTRLKRYQREVLLDRGIRRMHWTFDPLQSRNAHVNFAKLGIVSREYVEDMYGQTDSPLHRGVGTDRLVATWEMDSSRVEERLEGEERPPEAHDVGDLPRVLEVREGGRFPEPGDALLDLTDHRVLLNVPREIDILMKEDLALAVRWREASRVPFLHYSGRGYEVREFVREKNLSAYVLERSGSVAEGAEGDGSPEDVSGVEGHSGAEDPSRVEGDSRTKGRGRARGTP